MNEEWELIARDEKRALDEAVDYFIDVYLAESGYTLTGVETHYSNKNFQWEALVNFKSYKKADELNDSDCRTSELGGTG